MTMLAIANLGNYTVNDGQITKEGTGLEAQMENAKTELELGFACYKKTVEHVWRMGEALTKAKVLHNTLKKELGSAQPKWEDILKQYGISVPSDNRARRLYHGCPNIEQLEGLTIMEAYDLAGITRSVRRESETKDVIVVPAVAEKDSKTADSPNSDSKQPAEDEWPDVKESDLFDTADDEFEDNVESGDDFDPDLHISESDLSDPVDESQDVLDHLEAMIEEIQSVQTSKVLDDHLDEAVSRIEKLSEMMLQIKFDLEVRVPVHAAV